MYDSITSQICLTFNFWITRVLFVGPLISLFWTSGDVCSSFLNQSGQPYLCLAEAYVLHVHWDSPLVWHLLTLLYLVLYRYMSNMFLEIHLWCNTCQQLPLCVSSNGHPFSYSITYTDIYSRCYFIHIHLPQCLTQTSLLFDWDVISVDNC